MRKLLLFFICLPAFTPILAAQDALSTAPNWREKVAEAMPLLGHRNWILIVDSAYPLQSSPGIETIDTSAPQLEVVRHVLSTIDRSIHVRPDILMDAELPFVPEQDAPGVAAYRSEIADLLRAYPIESQPHDRILANIEEAADTSASSSSRPTWPSLTLRSSSAWTASTGAPTRKNACVPG